MQSVSAVDIAMSGIRAQRVRMNLIANNIANAETTRTAGGGPYRRQVAILEGEQLGRSMKPDRFGVDVKRIESDDSPFVEVHDPTHPDANLDGIVRYPNVNLVIEMINLVSAQRAYEANVNVIMSDRSMTERALEIIRQ